MRSRKDYLVVYMYCASSFSNAGLFFIPMYNFSVFLFYLKWLLPGDGTPVQAMPVGPLIFLEIALRIHFKEQCKYLSL